MVDFIMYGKCCHSFGRRIEYVCTLILFGVTMLLTGWQQDWGSLQWWALFRSPGSFRFSQSGRFSRQLAHVIDSISLITAHVQSYKYPAHALSCSHTPGLTILPNRSSNSDNIVVVLGQKIMYAFRKCGEPDEE